MRACASITHRTYTLSVKCIRAGRGFHQSCHLDLVTSTRHTFIFKSAWVMPDFCMTHSLLLPKFMLRMCQAPKCMSYSTPLAPMKSAESCGVNTCILRLHFIHPYPFRSDDKIPCTLRARPSALRYCTGINTTPVYDSIRYAMGEAKSRYNTVLVWRYDSSIRFYPLCNGRGRIALQYCTGINTTPV